MITKNKSNFNLIHSFFLLDPTGEMEYKTGVSAEKYTDQWLIDNKAILNMLMQGKTETLGNGVMRRYYEIYGEFIQ